MRLLRQQDRHGYCYAGTGSQAVSRIHRSAEARRMPLSEPRITQQKMNFHDKYILNLYYKITLVKISCKIA